MTRDGDAIFMAPKWQDSIEKKILPLIESGMIDDLIANEFVEAIKLPNSKNTSSINTRLKQQSPYLWKVLLAFTKYQFDNSQAALKIFKESMTRLIPCQKYLNLKEREFEKLLCNIMVKQMPSSQSSLPLSSQPSFSSLHSPSFTISHEIAIMTIRELEARLEPSKEINKIVCLLNTNLSCAMIALDLDSNSNLSKIINRFTKFILPLWKFDEILAKKQLALMLYNLKKSSLVPNLPLLFKNRSRERQDQGEHNQNQDLIHIKNSLDILVNVSKEILSEKEFHTHQIIKDITFFVSSNQIQNNFLELKNSLKEFKSSPLQAREFFLNQLASIDQFENNGENNIKMKFSILNEILKEFFFPLLPIDDFVDLIKSTRSILDAFEENSKILNDLIISIAISLAPSPSLSPLPLKFNDNLDKRDNNESFKNDNINTHYIKSIESLSMIIFKLFNLLSNKESYLEIIIQIYYNIQDYENVFINIKNLFNFIQRQEVLILDSPLIHDKLLKLSKLWIFCFIKLKKWTIKDNFHQNYHENLNIEINEKDSKKNIHIINNTTNNDIIDSSFLDPIMTRFILKSLTLLGNDSKNKMETRERNKEGEIQLLKYISLHIRLTNQNCPNSHFLLWSLHLLSLKYWNHIDCINTLIEESFLISSLQSFLNSNDNKNTLPWTSLGFYCLNLIWNFLGNNKMIHSSPNHHHQHPHFSFNSLFLGENEQNLPLIEWPFKLGHFQELREIMKMSKDLLALADQSNLSNQIGRLLNEQSRKLSLESLEISNFNPFKFYNSSVSNIEFLKDSHDRLYNSLSMINKINPHFSDSHLLSCSLSSSSSSTPPLSSTPPNDKNDCDYFSNWYHLFNVKCSFESMIQAYYRIGYEKPYLYYKNQLLKLSRQVGIESLSLSNPFSIPSLNEIDNHHDNQSHDNGNINHHDNQNPSIESIPITINLFRAQKLSNFPSPSLQFDINDILRNLYEYHVTKSSISYIKRVYETISNLWNSNIKKNILIGLLESTKNIYFINRELGDCIDYKNGEFIGNKDKKNNENQSENRNNSENNFYYSSYFSIQTATIQRNEKTIGSNSDGKMEKTIITNTKVISFHDWIKRLKGEREEKGESKSFPSIPNGTISLCLDSFSNILYVIVYPDVILRINFTIEEWKREFQKVFLDNKNSLFETSQIARKREEIIIAANVDSINSMNNNNSNSNSIPIPMATNSTLIDNSTFKREWWKTRQRLDSELINLLDKFNEALGVTWKLATRLDSSIMNVQIDNINKEDFNLKDIEIITRTRKQQNGNINDHENGNDDLDENSRVYTVHEISNKYLGSNIEMCFSRLMTAAGPLPKSKIVQWFIQQLLIEKKDEKMEMETEMETKIKRGMEMETDKKDKKINLNDIDFSSLSLVERLIRKCFRDSFEDVDLFQDASFHQLDIRENLNNNGNNVNSEFQSQSNNSMITTMILDSQLYFIPWESLLCTKHLNIVRIPSNWHLERGKYYNDQDQNHDCECNYNCECNVNVGNHINDTNKNGNQNKNQDQDCHYNISCVLNPSGDLINTENYFKSKIEKIINDNHNDDNDIEMENIENEKRIHSKNDVNHRGNDNGKDCNIINNQRFKLLSNKPPESRDVIEAIKNSKMAFLYLGHGSGNRYTSGMNMRELDRISPSLLLIGCSSGRMSIQHGFCPEGVILDYLYSGAHVVLANLWDISDRDIDKFTDDLMERVGLWRRQFDKDLIATRINEARKICYLKALNGYSPVIYGIPKR